MNLLVIDGQGGQLGSSIIRSVIAHFPELTVTAVGTNANATAAMVKAGAKKAATGENPVIVTAVKADIIIGPIGIVIADSMLGEITPAMARATGSSCAVKILIPVNKCENIVAGVKDVPTGQLIEDALSKLEEIIKNKS